jgi:hypothetical protein
VVLKNPDIWEERTGAIFTAEQYAEQETRGNLLLGIDFDPEDGGDMFLPNVDLSELQDVITLRTHRCENFKFGISLIFPLKAWMPLFTLCLHRSV